MTVLRGELSPFITPGGSDTDEEWDAPRQGDTATQARGSNGLPGLSQTSNVLIVRCPLTFSQETEVIATHLRDAPALDCVTAGMDGNTRLLERSRRQQVNWEKVAIPVAVFGPVLRAPSKFKDTRDQALSDCPITLPRSSVESSSSKWSLRRS